MKIRPVGAELFHADGRNEGRMDGKTDRRIDVTKPKIVFEIFQTRLKCHFLE